LTTTKQSFLYMKEALGAARKPTAWLQRRVFPSRFHLFLRECGNGDLAIATGLDRVSLRSANLRIENGPAKRKLTSASAVELVAKHYPRFRCQASRMNWQYGRARSLIICSILGGNRERSISRVGVTRTTGALWTASHEETGSCAESRRWSLKHTGGERGSTARALASGICATAVLEYVATVC